MNPDGNLGGAPGPGGRGGRSNGNSPGSGGLVGSGGGGGNGIPACNPDEKRCSNGMCVKLNDPGYGCAAASCSPCSLTNVATATCKEGSCAVVTCVPGFSDCDSQPDCETDIRQPSHCGRCANTCGGSTPVCMQQSTASYECSSGCSGSQVRCGSSCIDALTDVANCNGCNQICTIPNGTPRCDQGKCVPASCASGYTACGNGCVYTDGDTQNCGGCNLRCPSGSLCKDRLCEVRLGFPERFLGNESAPFQSLPGSLSSFPIQVARQVTLHAFGYINQSATVGAVASFGLYNETGAKSPGILIATAKDVTLKGAVQEVAVDNVVLLPGTYYFAILSRDDGEPKLFTSSTSMIDWWTGPALYSNGLPVTFSSVAPEVFRVATMNVYLVVQQSGS